MIIMGIDPGLTGAIALINGDKEILAATDMPVVAGHVNAAVLADLLRDARPDLVVVEQVGAMPGNGGASMFKFGWCYGAILGAVAALHLRIEHVRPAVWKTAMGLGTDKEKARSAAIDRWPHEATTLFARKKDHGRAEAALLAVWGLEHRA